MFKTTPLKNFPYLWKLIVKNDVDIDIKIYEHVLNCGDKTDVFKVIIEEPCFGLCSYDWHGNVITSNRIEFDMQGFFEIQWMINLFSKLKIVDNKIINTQK